MRGNHKIHGIDPTHNTKLGVSDVSTCILPPVYKRKFFYDSDNVPALSNRFSPVSRDISETQSWLPKVQPTVANMSNEESKDIDFSVDILFPTHLSLALVFSYLHGIPMEINQKMSLYEQEELFSSLKPLNQPNQKERSAALSQYCTIFTAMRQYLESKNIHVTVDTYCDFSLSHALIEMYRFQWYSTLGPSENDSPLCLQPSKTESSYLLSLEENQEDMTKMAIGRVRVFLHIWYTTHINFSSPCRIMEQCLRALTLLEDNSNQSLSVIRQETRVHLAKLLLLCHFDEFYQCIKLYSKKDDFLAVYLQETLIPSYISELDKSWKNRLSPQRFHEDCLEPIRLLVGQVELPYHGGENSDHHDTSSIQDSPFSFCYDILLGDESRLDYVIQQVFPNCIFSSFILGFFWRRLKISRLVRNLLDFFLTSPYDTGGIIAYFFNSWMEAHGSLEGDRRRAFRDTEVALIALLSHDVEQLVDFLSTHSHYLCSPLLMDLLSYDHPFPQKRQRYCEVLLSESSQYPRPKDVFVIYTFRAICEAHRELLRNPLTFPWGSSTHHEFRSQDQTKHHGNRYMYDDHETSKDTLLCGSGCDSSNQSVCMSAQQTIFDILHLCLKNPSDTSPETLQELYTFHCGYAVLGHLFLTIHSSESYVTVRLFCLFLDMLLTGQSPSVLHWISSHLVELLKSFSEKWIQQKEKAWQGLLIGLLALRLESDHHQLIQLKRVDWQTYLGCSNCCISDECHVLHPSIAQKEHWTKQDGLDDQKPLGYPHDLPLFSWRHKISFHFKPQSQRTTFQHHPFLDHLLLLPSTESFASSPKVQSCTSNFFFQLPEWCFIPQEFQHDAVHYLMTAHIYCPQLVFYMVFQFWHPEYQQLLFLYQTNGDQHTTLDKTFSFQQEKSTRYRDALYWLLECLVDLFVVPHAFDTVMNIILSALFLDQTNKRLNLEKTLLNLKQRQRLQSFWTSYTAGMFQETFPLPVHSSTPSKSCVFVVDTSAWSLKRDSPKRQIFGELLSQEHLCDIVSEPVCSYETITTWDPWIRSHLCC